jgi:sigma-B regulation protein RsbU (phosphoserine phosphatase)
VAGDYYDIINIDSDHTVLAIGDVSGKGAAAALMMSNIQASFRTAIGIGGGDEQNATGNRLSNIVARINDLIHRNTPPGQFITFFVAIYNNANKTITYVNAGHNPPMLMRPDGKIVLLDKGGLLLGAMPNMPYEQDTVQLETRDIMFLYTDGVSEAENAAGEMFEEKRIEELLLAHRDRPAAEILSTLETEVQNFIGEIPLADDFTTLVARVM